MIKENFNMSIRFDAGEVITAMVTPFDKNLKVDFEALGNLVEHLINNGSDGILVTGTTGESPTLSFDEELEILAFVKKKANGRVKIVMGAGSNSTQTAVEAAQKAQAAGADAVLTVVPYYNKPSQKGMYEHFAAIAKAVSVPVILYNIPGRTGVNMQPATIAKLANEFKNIVAVKQSNSDLDLISDMKMLCPNDFVIYSGDDSLTLPMLALGVHGVISVASHIVGSDVKKMISLFKAGNVSEATELHLKLYPLFRKLFMAPNPVPAKEALAKMGLMKNIVKMPLVTLDEEEKAEFLSVLKNYI